MEHLRLYVKFVLNKDFVCSSGWWDKRLFSKNSLFKIFHPKFHPATNFSLKYKGTGSNFEKNP